MKKNIFCNPGRGCDPLARNRLLFQNVNEPTANESSQSASSESSSNGMDESSPMDDLKEDAKDAVSSIRRNCRCKTVHNDWYDQRYQRLYVYDHRRRNRLWIQLRAGSETGRAFWCKDGDKVTVTYTGTVSEVDAFSGTVLSVKKAE